MMILHAEVVEAIRTGKDLIQDAVKRKELFMCANSADMKELRRIHRQMKHPQKKEQ